MPDARLVGLESGSSRRGALLLSPADAGNDTGRDATGRDMTASAGFPKVGAGPLTLGRSLRPRLGQMANSPLPMQPPREGEKRLECKWRLTFNYCVSRREGENNHQNFPRRLPFLKSSRNPSVPRSVTLTNFPGRSSHKTSSPSLPALPLRPPPGKAKRKERDGQTQFPGSHRRSLRDPIVSEAREGPKAFGTCCLPPRSLLPPGRTQSRTPACGYPPRLMQAAPCQKPSRAIPESPGAAWGHQGSVPAHASGSHLGVSLVALRVISPICCQPTTQAALLMH